jgi:predicted DNA-binding transcriptional regulator YafY
MYGLLKRAIEDKHLVELIYLDQKNQITQRKVFPYEIKEKHLRAYCFYRQQYRLFKLDQILSVFPTNSKKHPKSS